MTNYNGVSCPICNIPFKQGDDIVVCPDCGTPHHRHCYAQNGECANSASHGASFEFILPASAITFPCPNCGSACHDEQRFCEHCGTPLKPAEDPIGPAAQTPANAGTYGGFQGQQGQDPNVQGPGAGAGYYTLPANLDPTVGTVDDIPVADWAAFIGPQAEVYLAHFKRSDVIGRNTKFCWSAALMAPFYFFYRKMWKFGAMAAIANMLLNMPTLLLNLNTTLGIALPIAAETLTSISMFTFPIMLIFNGMWGLTAFPRYREFAAEKIKQITSLGLPDDQKYQQLSKAGGPSKIMLALAVFVLVYELMYMLT